MYIECIQTRRNNKVYRTWLLRESFRQDGRVRHRTLANLTALPEELIRFLQDWLRQGKKPTGISPAVAGQEGVLVVRDSREYGASATFMALAKELGLEKLIWSRPEAWRKKALALIVGRLVYQGSKLGLTQRYRDSALWEMCGLGRGEEPQVERDAYAVMDRLLERQDAIQRALARKHLEKGCLVYYDLTSVYTEGQEQEKAEGGLVGYGYSRDGKRGHPQVGVGLLTDAQGCPVAVEVFHGSVVDSSTVVEQIRRLGERYGVEEVVVAGDRGMLRPKRIEQLNRMGCRTLTALTHPQVRKLLERKVIQLELFDEREEVEVWDPQEGQVRYILCKNPWRGQEERRTRQKLMERAERELARLARQKRGRTEAEWGQVVGVVLTKWKVTKLFRWWVKEGRLEYEVDQEAVAAEEALDGCYVLRTDVPREQMDASTVHQRYKGLGVVERAFRNLKTVALEIRPMYHWRPDRIRAHVFVCMLAYYVQWHALKRLEPLWAEGGKGRKRRWTWERVVERLKSVRLEELWAQGQWLGSAMTQLDEEQARIVELLGVKLKGRL